MQYVIRGGLTSMECRCDWKAAQDSNIRAKAASTYYVLAGAMNWDGKPST